MIEFLIKYNIQNQSRSHTDEEIRTRIGEKIESREKFKIQNRNSRFVSRIRLKRQRTEIRSEE
jgi:hypothetical protein